MEFRSLTLLSKGLLLSLGSVNRRLLRGLKTSRKLGRSAALRLQSGTGLGIKANAMCVWNVPDEKIEAVGNIMAEFPEVTHCYERPRYPDWPYNLFTMIHSYTPEKCEEIAVRISEATGIKDYTLFFSEREFKKTGVRL